MKYIDVIVAYWRSDSIDIMSTPKISDDANRNSYLGKERNEKWAEFLKMK